MQKTIFHLEAMDCASEEQLVRMRLAGIESVRSLRFDLQQRTVEVLHDGVPSEIEDALRSLQLGSTLVRSEPVHDIAPDSGDEGHRRLLMQVLAINAAFFLIEIVAGLIARSMGLMADSLDMLADSIVYGLSLYAVGKSARHKGGVAATSGVFQLLLALLGVVETVRRFTGREEVPSFGPMIGVSLFALLANATCLYLLQRSRSREAHMQASMIFTSNDVIANIGVIVAGILVLLTASKVPDLIAGVAIFLLVARGAVRILRLARQPSPDSPIIGGE